MNKKITGQIIISPETVSDIEKKVKNLSGFKKNIESVLQENITEVLENILIGAINLNASDIHIEPRKKEIKIRIRIDGMLQEVSSLDKKIFVSLLSRIKLLSALKLNVSDRPQDGRFSIISKQETIEIRTSSLPSEYG